LKPDAGNKNCKLLSRVGQIYRYIRARLYDDLMWLFGRKGPVVLIAVAYADGYQLVDFVDRGKGTVCTVTHK